MLAKIHFTPVSSSHVPGTYFQAALVFCGILIIYRRVAAAEEIGILPKFIHELQN